MPVVPMPTPVKPRSGPRRIEDTRPPPSTPFAMMAAAQMHSEGRLIPNDDGSPLPPQLGGKEPT
jgi:hypothetical protein